MISAALAAPAAAAAAPNPLHHDLAIVDSHLRIGLETGPAKLADAIGAAGYVCDLGREATARLEPEAATADWATLDQLVERRAEDAAHRVDVALANADSMLSLTGRRFGAGTGADGARSRRLGHFVTETRHGIRVMLIAIQDLSRPFASWRGQECTAASSGLKEAFHRTPAAMQQINVGMIGLWEMSRRSPS